MVSSAHFGRAAMEVRDADFPGNRAVSVAPFKAPNGLHRADSGAPVQALEARVGETPRTPRRGDPSGHLSQPPVGASGQRMSLRCPTQASLSSSVSSSCRRFRGYSTLFIVGQRGRGFAGQSFGTFPAHPSPQPRPLMPARKSGGRPLLAFTGGHQSLLSEMRLELSSRRDRSNC
jgi:hypothetical protein